jgi:hypothetical protein
MKYAPARRPQSWLLLNTSGFYFPERAPLTSGGGPHAPARPPVTSRTLHLRETIPAQRRRRRRSHWEVEELLPGIAKLTGFHGRMARGSHGIPKVSLGPALLDPSTPCGRATPETALQPFQGWPAAVYYPFGHPAPYAYVFHSLTIGTKKMTEVTLSLRTPCRCILPVKWKSLSGGGGKDVCSLTVGIF